MVSHLRSFSKCDSTGAKFLHNCKGRWPRGSPQVRSLEKFPQLQTEVVKASLAKFSQSKPYPLVRIRMRIPKVAGVATPDTNNSTKLKQLPNSELTLKHTWNQMNTNQLSYEAKINVSDSMAPSKLWTVVVINEYFEVNSML